MNDRVSTVHSASYCIILLKLKDFSIDGFDFTWKVSYTIFSLNLYGKAKNIKDRN